MWHSGMQVLEPQPVGTSLGSAHSRAGHFTLGRHGSYSKTKEKLKSHGRVNQKVSQTLTSSLELGRHSSARSVSIVKGYSCRAVARPGIG